MKLSKVLWLSTILLVTHCHADFENEDQLSLFQLEEGFEMELVASEPLVMDPVAMEIDENGNFYVVEMPGYPMDVTGSGRVVLLKDHNGDGQMDERVLFADNLVLPNGITCWKNGVVVTDAPDVLYLEDTNGDGKADKREVLLTGFSRSNPQHNLNTPKYGLDNWIYLAHEGAFITKTFVEEFGGEGQEIVFPNQPNTPKLPKNANDHAVRFKPDQHQLEMLSGSTQYGYGFDDWGHLFYTSNAHHLFHEVIAAPYLNKAKHLPLRSTRQYLPEYGPGAEIYPITQNPEHQVLTDVGTITSSCGLTLYQGGAFPASYDQLSFIAEPVHNLVHTSFLEEQGATYIAKRHLEQKEFLASEDSWFRPVNFYIGPMGDMYLVDYYRQYIEHPEWMAKEVVESGQLYNGMDKGRIYRIKSKKNTSHGQALTFAGLSPTQIIEKLGHPNIWWRRNAQRLLVQSGDSSLKPDLVAFGQQTEHPLGLLHAMWTLEGLGLHDLGLVKRALQHNEAGLRENALKILEHHPQSMAALQTEVFALANDPSPKVRFQLLCTLSLLEGNEAKEIIQTILLKDLKDEWVQYMALAAIEDEAYRLVTTMPDKVSSTQYDDAYAFLVKASTIIGKQNNQPKTQTLIKEVIQTKPSWWQPAVLKGLAVGLNGQIQQNKHHYDHLQQALLDNFDAQFDAKYRRASLDLLAVLGMANVSTKNAITKALKWLEQAEDVNLRMDAVKLLSISGAVNYVDQLKALVDQGQPIEVQKAALEALSGVLYEKFKLDAFVFEQWPTLTPSIQEKAMTLMAKKEKTAWAILDRVEAQQLAPANIKWPVKLSLLNHDLETIKTKARKLLVEDFSLTDEAFQAYQVAIQEAGDRAGGKEVFSAACSSCHQMGGTAGLHFGPDLASIRNRSKASILYDVLYPNHAIADGYALWEVVSDDEQIIHGVLEEESNRQLLFRTATGEEITIERDKIKTMAPMAQSAMPEGLAQQISTSEMRDLISYLKRPL